MGGQSIPIGGTLIMLIFRIGLLLITSQRHNWYL